MARIEGNVELAWQHEGSSARVPILHAFAYLVVLVPVMLALATSFAITPEDIESGRVVLSPPCILKQWAGVECPTCGMTRAFAALSHGRFGCAVEYNHFAPAAYAAFWAIALVGSAGVVRALAEIAAIRKGPHQ
jgi:hypothetical protein